MIFVESNESDVESAIKKAGTEFFQYLLFLV